MLKCLLSLSLSAKQTLDALPDSALKAQYDQTNKKTLTILPNVTSCVSIAVAHNFSEEKHSLMNGDVNINEYNEGETFLIKSIKHQDVELSSFLIRKGADTNLLSLRNQSSPLIWAVKIGNHTLVSLLIAYSAHVNYVVPWNGATALMVAVSKSHYQIIQTLLDAGADINKFSFNRRSALTLAVKKENCDLVKFLLARGANIEHRDENSYTALMIATINNNHAMVQVLLASGANAHQLDHKGYSPLMWAVFNGDTRMVDLLINYSDINYMTIEKYSAMSIAQERLSHLQDLCKILDYNNIIDILDFTSTIQRINPCSDNQLQILFNSFLTCSSASESDKKRPRFC
jgi:ankyrin repeat protein